MRVIYQCLLRLHPVQFRTRFGGEMLSIFDGLQGAADKCSLLQDAFLSVFRQWLFRQKIDVFKLICKILEALLPPSIIGVNLAVVAQFVGFFIAGGPPIIKLHQAAAVFVFSGCCLGALGMFRSQILFRRPVFYVWLKLT